MEEASERFAEFEIIENSDDMREFSDEFDEGEILKQRPREDEINSTGKIYVTLSKGKRTESVTMPDVIDMGEEQAKIVLDRAELLYTITKINSDEIQEGNVIKTEPDVGADVSSDETVVVYVSLGKENKETKVPNLLGLTEAKAIESLAAEGLEKGTVSYANSDSVEKGNIISQEPVAGESVAEGTTIGFTISLGPAQKESPKKEQETIKPSEEPKTPVEEKPSEPPAEEKKEDTVEITRSIRLPSEPENFSVKITVNGTVQYEKTHSGTEESVDVKLKGKGESIVCVYINDVLRQEISIDFK